MRSIVVTHKDIIDSEYNSRHCRGAQRIAYETLDELVTSIEAAVKSGADQKFVYAYWPVYDMLSHRFGAESPEAFAALEAIDAAFEALLARLSGTESVVIATADHGFIDVPPEDSLELPAFLASDLRFPLCGERRVVYCHVHQPKAFMEKAKEWLGERADVMPSRALRRRGLVRARARRTRASPSASATWRW